MTPANKILHKITLTVCRETRNIKNNNFGSARNKLLTNCNSTPLIYFDFKQVFGIIKNQYFFEEKDLWLCAEARFCISLYSPAFMPELVIFIAEINYAETKIVNH